MIRTLRQELVRAAGRHRRPAWIACAIAIETATAAAKFADQLSNYTWGPPNKLPRELVRVPRSLRRIFGASVSVLKRSGRRRKDRRKHNRRWMPNQDDPRLPG